MKVDEELVMALPRKLVEQDPINEHLIKWVGFDFPDEQRQHFRPEMKTGSRKIQRLRIEPNTRPGSQKFYFNLLFDYPFGGVEVLNARSIADQIAEDYGLVPTKSPEEVVVWLRDFHKELAARLHDGEDVP